MEKKKNNKRMKNILKISATILIAMVCVISCRSYSGGPDRDKLILQLIYKILENAHYENIRFDDEFSSKAMDEYLDKLDYSKRFLLRSDVDELNKQRYNFDDMLRHADMSFAYSCNKLIKERQKEAENYYKEAIESDFDFNGDEWYQTNPDSLDYAASKDDLRIQWGKLVKYAVLERYYDLKKSQDKAIQKSDTVKVKSDEELKAEAVKRVRESYDDWMRRINSIKEDDWTALFFNSIVAACDPHSDFFPPEDKKSFDISMSGKFEGIGATLQSKNGQTKVTDIIPGSASWRQGELEVGDIIMMVAQGDEPPVDITNMLLDDAVKLIRGKKGSTVKLTVKKVDGTVKVIPIVRDVVIIEETYAKSSVLTSPDGKTKVGYIYLPKFYADFQDNNGRFCSKDVKAEVRKLKAAGVDGIVLDLRNNGGGSLSDVIDMSGLFIKKGPIVQVRTRDGEVRQHNDNDANIEYDGPMVVMVNNYSASASEILAAALQDYNRAIIMGSNSSFGKGTVQSIYDLDRLARSSEGSLGAMKLTIQKFYRINGGTTQLKGVIPDIILPDSYSYMEIGEKEQHNALPYDNIPKAQYELWTPTYRKKKVISASQERISKNPVFRQIDDNARRLKKRADESCYSLNYNKYVAYQTMLDNESEKYSKIGKDPTGIKATFAPADKAAAEGDTIKTAKFTKWFGEIEKDIYILEATNVISDMK